VIEGAIVARGYAFIEAAKIATARSISMSDGAPSQGDQKEAKVLDPVKEASHFMVEPRHVALHVLSY